VVPPALSIPAAGFYFPPFLVLPSAVPGLQPGTYIVGFTIRNTPFKVIKLPVPKNLFATNKLFNS
jgi:hypothetical protein